MKKAGMLGMALLLFLLVPVIAGAQVWQTEPQGLSLTEALAGCADGDIIELADGTYNEERESFPLTVTHSVTIRAAEGAVPVIDAPAFVAALRIEAAGVTLCDLDIRFRRTGIYAIGDGMTLQNCRISLADSAWRTSSCGMWCGGIYNMHVSGCSFTGCGISLAGPPLSERSKDLPVLTGLFEVGEEIGYFTTHTIENCTVNDKPLFYAVNEELVNVPADAGEAICCGCGEVIAEGVDVSDGSMGMVLVYNGRVTLTDCRADRCGVFGLYIAKCNAGLLKNCSAAMTNHGLDIRASKHIILEECVATDCDQGLFFSQVHDSAMTDCRVSNTGQGYFMAGGSGNALLNCEASICENGFNLQKEGHVLMAGCTIEACTTCGVRLDATPTAFVGNTLRNNWVAVMAYGGVSFDLADNVFEDTQCCALYLRDIAYSRFTGNQFTGSRQMSVQANGSMGGSVFTGNTLDAETDLESAQDLGFIR